MAMKSLKLPRDVPLYRIFNEETRVLVASHIEATKGQLLTIEEKLQEVRLGLYARPAYRVANRADEIFYILPEDVAPEARRYVDEWIDMRNRRGDSPHPHYIREPIDGYMADVEKEMAEIIAPHIRAHLRAAS